MRRDEYTAANRLAWEQAAPVHEGAAFDRLLRDFNTPGHSCLDQVETEILRDIGLAGRAVAHLCCNNGRELLSVKRLGAGRCVGFDISEGFIEQARRLAAASGLDCEFIRTDVYDIPRSYDGAFGLVYVSAGTLGWMPELPPFFETVARLLAPRGRLFVYEIHPILNMFEEHDRADPPQLRHSYFRREPFVDDTGLDYYDMTAYESAPLYWFPHTLSDILGGCVGGGFALESFREYGHDVSSIYAHFEEHDARLPLSYTLIAGRA